MAFSIPIPKSPLVDKQGIINRDWFVFLSNLLTAVANGASGNSNEVLHGGSVGYAQVVLSQDVIGVLPSANGGTGINNGTNTLTLLNSVTISQIGTIATQDSSNVSITGGTVSNVTVNAVTLTANSTFSLNNQVSTGGTTATFTAVNKPGVSTTTPDAWIMITIDGSVRYIPCWP